MLESILKRQSLIVGAALAVLTVAAAIYTVLGVGMNMSAVEMTAMRGAGMADMSAQPRVGFVALFLMWWIMMIAMMVPSAAPTVLLYAAIRRHSSASGDPARPVVAFVAGYLIVWAAFSLAAAALQWWLELRGIVSPGTMALTGQALAGGVLIAAGLYQFSSLKGACLRHCRSPADFISRRYRRSIAGALAMGLEHGAFCVGCCWFLMALLFVGGVMNLYVILGLALFVLAEKHLPHGWLIARIAGGTMLAGGAWLCAAAAGLAG